MGMGIPRGNQAPREGHDLAWDHDDVCMGCRQPPDASRGLRGRHRDERVRRPGPADDADDRAGDGQLPRVFLDEVDEEGSVEPDRAGAKVVDQRHERRSRAT